MQSFILLFKLKIFNHNFSAFKKKLFTTVVFFVREVIFAKANFENKTKVYKLLLQQEVNSKNKKFAWSFNK